MARTTKPAPLSAKQITKLKSLIKEALKSGTPLISISENHEEYSYRAVRYWKKKINNTPKFSTYTQKQLQEIEKIIRQGHAQGLGITEIQRNNTKYKINIYKRVNESLGIIPVQKRRRFHDGMKLLILYYAKYRGVMEASREFDVNDGQITEWNAKFDIYSPKVNPDALTEEQRLKILVEVAYYNFYSGGFSGPVVIAEKYSISDSSIYAWNSEYHIFKTQYSHNIPKTSDNDITRILNAAEYCSSISELSRATAFSKELISKVLEENGLYYNQYGLQKVSNNQIEQQVVQQQLTAGAER